MEQQKSYWWIVWLLFSIASLSFSIFLWNVVPKYPDTIRFNPLIIPGFFLATFLATWFRKRKDKKTWEQVIAFTYQDSKIQDEREEQVEYRATLLSFHISVFLIFAVVWILQVYPPLYQLALRVLLLSLLMFILGLRGFRRWLLIRGQA